MSLLLRAHVLIDPSLVTPARLQELTDLLADFAPVLQSVGGAIEEGLAENFDSRGFGSWAPLSAATRKDKARRGYGGQPDLVRTGRLRAALTERDAPGHKFLIGKSSVTVGCYTDVASYASYLAQGTRRMPARVLINVGPDTRDKIIEIITAWLGGGPGVRVFLDAPLETE